MAQRDPTDTVHKLPRPDPDPTAVLNAIATPLFVVDHQDCLCFVNLAAESFFGASRSTLLGQTTADLMLDAGPVGTLLDQARRSEGSVAEYEVALNTPRTGERFVSIGASPMPESAGSIVVTIQERAIARKFEHQLSHRNAARSVGAMAAMLAHEVKNPLSGIRGAAQLLEQSSGEEGRELTQLICEEADRIVGLVDRMEMFSPEQTVEREALNIHEILEHVRRLAETGFAAHVRFKESYDPSLPAVLGHRDLLIQALLNLVKNAAEAVPAEGGEITLATRYQPGVRMSVRGSDRRVELPLIVTVRDNGPGIPEHVQSQLFDPFVTTKNGGKGLGLSLVAKVVDDHGGIIEFDSQARRTEFRLQLPIDKGGARS